MKIIEPILFVLIASIGNAIYTIGQKKAEGVDNIFSFIMLCASVAAIISLIFAPLQGQPNYASVIRQAWPWISVSGIGLFMTYVGFYLLYSRYGATQYINYAVVSLVITVIFVGVLYFGETINSYHWLAMASASLTVILYAIGEST